ncbi:MAG: hypothetical protein ACJ8F7_15065 [Gemmataceae bacterium]
MQKRNFTAIALVLVLSGSGFALSPTRNIVIKPRYPDAPGLAEVQTQFWHDIGGGVSEIEVELLQVATANGKRVETCVNRGKISELVNASGGPGIALRMEVSGTYFFRCTLRTIDPIAGMRIPNVVKVTPDTTVQFK